MLKKNVNAKPKWVHQKSSLSTPKRWFIWTRIKRVNGTDLANLVNSVSKTSAVWQATYGMSIIWHPRSQHWSFARSCAWLKALFGQTRMQSLYLHSSGWCHHGSSNNRSNWRPIIPTHLHCAWLDKYVAIAAWPRWAICVVYVRTHKACVRNTIQCLHPQETWTQCYVKNRNLAMFSHIRCQRSRLNRNR